MQESPSPHEEGSTILRGDSETPFKSGNALQVTPAEHAGIVAFIRELKPGLYLKCSRCQRMKYNTSVTFANEMVYCEECN